MGLVKRLDDITSKHFMQNTAIIYVTELDFIYWHDMAEGRKKLKERERGSEHIYIRRQSDRSTDKTIHHMQSLNERIDSKSPTYNWKFVELQAFCAGFFYTRHNWPLSLNTKIAK